MEPRGEPAEEGEVGLVTDGCRDGVEAEAELMAKDGCHPRDEPDVDVRGEPGLDPPDLRVRDPEHRCDLAGAEPGAEPGTPQLLAESSKQERGSTRSPLCGGLPGGHAG